MSWSGAMSWIVAEEREPRRAMLMLHGALGSQRNWRSFAKRLVERRPSLAVLLADLRGHGDSPQRPGPHRLAAAAHDLLTITTRGTTPVDALLGHSLGGSVALELARIAPPEELWLIDSSPGARPDRRGADGLMQALDLLEALTYPLADRQELVDAATRLGLSQQTGQFLATNLEAHDDGLHLRVDLAVLRSLLDDHFLTDRWELIEEGLADTAIHLVVGLRSDVYGEKELARATRAAATRPNVFLHTLADAGHWVHIDAPDALLELVATSYEIGSGCTETG